jgi:hypothetical protein
MRVWAKKLRALSANRSIPTMPMCLGAVEIFIESEMKSASDVIDQKFFIAYASRGLP